MKQGKWKERMKMMMNRNVFRRIRKRRELFSFSALEWGGCPVRMFGSLSSIPASLLLVNNIYILT
jgi:hypothetical protein